MRFRLKDQLKDKPYFWIGISLCVLFIVLTDVRILLGSAYPYLYGITDTFHSRFEETILYTPYISNFSWTHFFKLDYVGANLAEGLAPYPYFAILILGVIHTLTGHHLNITVLLIHSLIIVEFGLGYAVTKRLGANDLLAACVGLVLVFDTVALPLFGVGLMGSGLVLFGFYYGWRYWRKEMIGAALGVGVGLFLLRYLIPYSARLQRGVNDLMTLKHNAITAATQVSAAWTDATFYADLYGTRFISPLLPMIMLLAGLLGLLVSYQRLQAKQQITWWAWGGLAIVLSLNVYTYYANALILAPLILVWIVLSWRQLWTERRGVTLAVVTGALLLTPFLYALFQGNHNAAYSEFAYRAAARGIVEYATNNYPILLSEYWIILFGLIAAYVLALVRQRKHINFLFLSPLLLYGSVIGWFHFNYLMADTVPQAYLLQRYLVPCILLALIPLYHWLMRQEQPLVQRGLRMWWQGSLVVITVMVIGLALGRYHTHQAFSGPGMEAQAANLAYVKPYLTSEAILVSNQQPLNILAPGILGVRTLIPNPISTVGTHESFVTQYAQHSKLLGYSEADYEQLIGNIDRYGVVHVHQSHSPAGVHLYTQTQGIPYPLPSDWLEDNATTLSHIYTETTIEDILAQHQSIYLYLIDAPLPTGLESHFSLVVSDGRRALYEQIN